MKRRNKALILVPLIALVLSGCVSTFEPEDKPEQEAEDYYTPEGEYDVDTSEPEESDSSNEEDSHTYSYSVTIFNKEDFEYIYQSEDDPNTNTYTLTVYLNSYTDDILETSELASIDQVYITSSNPEIINLDGFDLLLGEESGEVTLTIYWLDHLEAYDSLTIDYTYQQHVVDTKYIYELEIVNKEELGSTWLTNDNPREVELKLTKYTYDGDTLIDVDDSITPQGNVELTSGVIESEYDNVVGIDGFSVSPAHPGSAYILASWLEGGVSDYVEVIVEEAYFDGNYSIYVNSEEITSTNWYLGDSSRKLSGTLSYTSTAYSDETNVITHTIEMTEYNVDIVIKDESGEDSSILINEGLSLIPVGVGQATVYVSWISDNEVLAITSFSVTILEPLVEVYTLQILNKTALQETWYLEDIRELDISVTPANEVAVEQNVSDLINNGEINVNVTPSDSLDVSISSGKIYLTPLKASEEVLISVSWEGHPEAYDNVSTSIGEHIYKVTITNSEYLSTPWSVNQGPRTLEYELYLDGSLLNNETGYIELATSDETLVTIDGLTIYPQGEGNPIIYILWYDNYLKDNLLAYDLVTLDINTRVSATGVTISPEIIVFSDITESYEVSATVYGLNNELASNQDVSWEVSNSAFTLTETGDENTMIINATQYNASGSITVTSADGGFTASCSLSIGDCPAIPTPNIGEDQTYKLGADASEGDYHFFNGELTTGTDTYLAITNDWNKAQDVYITANPYDGVQNSFTISFVNESGQLKYLNNNNDANTVTLSDDPVIWVYNQDNNVLAVNSSSGHALFLYNGSSIRCYQQNSTN